MRSSLISAISSAISTYTQFAVSQELPWSQNNTPLFRKNMRKVYVDKQYQEQSTLIPVLDGADVFQNDLICLAYLAVDAKNPPSQLDDVISAILSCKSQTGVVNFGNESDYTQTTEEDVLILTFEFRLNTAIT